MRQQTFYLALDAHPGQCQLAVMSESGQMVSCKNYRTRAPDLIESVSKIPGRKLLVVEESQIADWIKRTLSPYVDELTIADPKVNSWIARAEYVDDKIAASRLAKLFRGGYIKPVYHGDSRRQQFKELVLHYHDLTVQITRFKNKIKGEFIAKAVAAKGPAIYQPQGFKHYLKQIPDLPLTQLQARNYFDILNHLVALRIDVLKKIRPYYKIYPEINQLRAIPAIGQVSAFTISAVIDTPQRFLNKRKLWAYCSLAKSEKISNGKSYANGPSKNGNRLLKHLFLQAAKTALRCKADSAFKQTALRLRAQGIDEHNIKRTVARQIASVVFKLWKSGESYRPIVNP